LLDLLEQKRSVTTNKGMAGATTKKNLP